VLDAGARIQPGSTDREVLVAALQIAIGKYGKKLEVRGDQNFVEQVTRAAHGQQVIVQKQQQREKGGGTLNAINHQLARVPAIDFLIAF
jgi:hypothetical protein